MIHTFLHKIFGLSLSLLVILSGMSFTVNKHYCKKSRSYHCACSEEKASCSIEFNNCCKETSHESKDSKICNSTCCITISQFVKGIDVVQKTSEQPTLKIQPSTLLTRIYNLKTGFLYKELFFNQKFLHPPNHFKSFTILFQVFRI